MKDYLLQEGNESYLEIKPEPEVKRGFHPTRMYLWQKIFWEDLEKKILKE